MITITGKPVGEPNSISQVNAALARIDKARARLSDALTDLFVRLERAQRPGQSEPVPTERVSSAGGRGVETAMAPLAADLGHFEDALLRMADMVQEQTQRLEL